VLHEASTSAVEGQLIIAAVDWWGPAPSRSSAASDDQEGQSLVTLCSTIVGNLIGNRVNLLLPPLLIKAQYGSADFSPSTIVGDLIGKEIRCCKLKGAEPDTESSKEGS
jgi:hypothetical protein